MLVFEDQATKQTESVLTMLQDELWHEMQVLPNSSRIYFGG